MTPISQSEKAGADIPAAIASLNEALDFYHHAALRSMHAYQAAKATAIVLAATIPVLTTVRAPSIAVAIVGSAILVSEGFQQIFHVHDRYVTYRSAWNALDRERRLYEGAAGPYKDNARALTLLAERVDRILANERDHWAAETARDVSAPARH